GKGGAIRQSQGVGSMRTGLLTLTVGLAAAGLLSRSIAATASGEAARAPQAPHTTTLSDQVDLSLTVYNSDIALVRDVRNLRLPTGTFDLQFMDIAATVNPATVHFRSLTQPSAVGVLEQNYEY